MPVSSRLLSDITLSLRAADQTDAAGEATAILQRLARKFVPLIGPASVKMIVERSLDACQADYPWLAPASDPIIVTPPYDGMRAAFERVDKEEVLAATAAVLMTYVTQLNTLIGGRLTEQFVRATFPVPADIKDSRSKPE